MVVLSLGEGEKISSLLSTLPSFLHHFFFKVARVTICITWPHIPLMGWKVFGGFPTLCKSEGFVLSPSLPDPHCSSYPDYPAQTSGVPHWHLPPSVGSLHIALYLWASQLLHALKSQLTLSYPCRLQGLSGPASDCWCPSLRAKALTLVGWLLGLHTLFPAWIINPCAPILFSYR
jgi:hypothetical protein